MMRSVRGTQALLNELPVVVRRLPVKEAVLFGLLSFGSGTAQQPPIVTIPDAADHPLEVDIRDIEWLEQHR